jgi:hypothetical protein
MVDMAEPRKISPEELEKILAEHKKWIVSDGKEGKRADLSKANIKGAYLSRAYLSEANLIGVNLSWANLSGAYLSEAKLNGADLSDADLADANLSGADLDGADLCMADLTGANLSGANLKGVDLSEAVLGQTKIREEDLSGVKYRPEQLKDMIIELPEKEPLIVPDQKGQLIVGFPSESPPLMHVIYLTAFIEYQYDILYILLFSQYDSFDKLSDILSGSPFHMLKDKDEAVKVVSMSTQSPIEVVLRGLRPIWLTISSLAAYFALPKEAKKDLYYWLRKSIHKTDEEKLKEELLHTEVLTKNAELLKICRDLGVAPADLIRPGEEDKPLPPALHDQGLKRLSKQIEHQQNDLSTRPPRIDLLKTVLLLRQEGLLTNKLKDQEIANLLEVHMENFGREFESLRKQLGDFKMDIEEEDDKEPDN